MGEGHPFGYHTEAKRSLHAPRGLVAQSQAGDSAISLRGRGGWPPEALFPQHVGVAQDLLRYPGRRPV